MVLVFIFGRYPRTINRIAAVFLAHAVYIKWPNCIRDGFARRLPKMKGRERSLEDVVGDFYPATLHRQGYRAGVRRDRT